MLTDDTNPTHSAPHVAESGSKLLNAAGQSIEVSVPAGDKRGRLHQFVAHLPGLIGRLRLLEGFTGGPRDAAHRRDAWQLTDPPRHLLQVGERLRAAQVVWGLNKEELLNGGVHREMASHHLVSDVALGRIGKFLRSS